MYVGVGRVSFLRVLLCVAACGSVRCSMRFCVLQHEVLCVFSEDVSV
jgi:hypothetical protein